MKKSKIDLVLEYFNHFTEKNLTALHAMFSPDIELIDWDICANGIDKVINENKKIFDSVDSINVLVRHMAQEDSKVFSEIDVIINEDTVIKVVDIITFDTHNKIVKIQAYKQ